jgi:cyclopropane fatty-acyl-phospholipid synthase-like methyltransferase
MDPKRLVEAGYDRIGGRHHDWGAAARKGEKARYAAAVFERLPAGASVLELGCGSGSTTTERLAERFRLTGVDLSARQIALIRRRIPRATFIHADMASIDFPPASFDAVVAFYSIIHLPREEHGGLIRRVATWLRPGGLFVATMGAHSTEAGYEADWLGAPMYWSHFDAETNRRLVQNAGLQILTAQEETAEEHGQPTTFLWIVARRPGSTAEGFPTAADGRD